MYIEDKLLRASEWLSNAHRAIGFGAAFVWLIAFYILYQLYRKKFLLWLIWGEILGILDWLYSMRFAFFGFPEKPLPPITDIALSIAGQVLSFLTLIVSTVGAIMGLSFLQKMFREVEHNKER